MEGGYYISSFFINSVQLEISFLKCFFSFNFRQSRCLICNLNIAPCKGIQDSLGFWIPCCGFRIPGTGFRIPDSSTVDSGFQKEVDSIRGSSRVPVTNP